MNIQQNNITTYINSRSEKAGRNTNGFEMMQTNFTSKEVINKLYTRKYDRIH